MLAAALLVCAGCPAAPAAAGAANPPTVSFNRDVRPILSDNCFHCHGFDSSNRKADLRLDSFEGATATRKEDPAIAPGSLERSGVWKHVSSRDPNLTMPPPNSGKKLKTEQIETLRKWILEGGAYQKHWAFEKPVRPAAPGVKATAWPRNDIDRFILATLEQRA